MSSEINELIARLRDVASDVELQEINGDEAAAAIRGIIVELKRFHGIDDRYRDPFEIVGDIPTDVSYQWVTLTVLGEQVGPNHDYWLEQGWAFVPPERHPEMPANDGKIVLLGQVLLEHSTAHVERARDVESHKAERAVDHWVTFVEKIEMPSGFTPISGFVSAAGGLRRVGPRKEENE